MKVKLKMGKGKRKIERRKKENGGRQETDYMEIRY